MSFLNVLDLRSCQQVNRKLYRICNDSRLWESHVDAYINKHYSKQRYELLPNLYAQNLQLLLKYTYIFDELLRKKTSSQGQLLEMRDQLTRSSSRETERDHEPRQVDRTVSLGGMFGFNHNGLEFLGKYITRKCEKARLNRQISKLNSRIDKEGKNQVVFDRPTI